MALALLPPTPVHAAGAQVLAAQGNWAALKFGDRCEAVARPLLPAARRQPEARAGFGFTATGHGQFHVRLSRVPRAGSSVMLTIGERPFMLIARGDWAWRRRQWFADVELVEQHGETARLRRPLFHRVQMLDLVIIAKFEVLGRQARHGPAGSIRDDHGNPYRLGIVRC